MAATVEGGKKAAVTNKRRHGIGFYHDIGRKGGLASRGGGFAANRELARQAGRKGGIRSRKPPTVKESQLMRLIKFVRSFT